MSRRTDWVPAQLVALDRMAGALPLAELAREVSLRGPAHNEHAVRVRASIEGVSLTRRTRRHPWDDEQDGIIRELAGWARPAEIGLEIRRRCLVVRSEHAVERRAERLGISLDRTALLTILDVCRIFPVSDRRIKALIEAGDLPGRRQGLLYWSICPSELEAFLLARPWLFRWQDVRHPYWQRLVYDGQLRQSWLTVEQAAERLGVSTQHARRLVIDGALPGARRVGPRRAWRVPAEALVGALVRRIRGHRSFPRAS